MGVGCDQQVKNNAMLFGRGYTAENERGFTLIERVLALPRARSLLFSGGGGGGRLGGWLHPSEHSSERGLDALLNSLDVAADVFGTTHSNCRRSLALSWQYR